MYQTFAMWASCVICLIMLMFSVFCMCVWPCFVWLAVFCVILCVSLCVVVCACVHACVCSRVLAHVHVQVKSCNESLGGLISHWGSVVMPLSTPALMGSLTSETGEKQGRKIRLKQVGKRTWTRWYQGGKKKHNWNVYFRTDPSCVLYSIPTVIA